MRSLEPSLLAGPGPSPSTHRNGSQRPSMLLRVTFTISFLPPQEHSETGIVTPVSDGELPKLTAVEGEKQDCTHGVWAQGACPRHRAPAVLLQCRLPRQGCPQDMGRGLHGGAEVSATAVPHASPSRSETCQPFTALPSVPSRGPAGRPFSWPPVLWERPAASFLQHVLPLQVPCMTFNGNRRNSCNTPHEAVKRPGGWAQRTQEMTLLISGRALCLSRTPPRFQRCRCPRGHNRCWLVLGARARACRALSTSPRTRPLFSFPTAPTTGSWEYADSTASRMSRQPSRGLACPAKSQPERVSVFRGWPNGSPPDVGFGTRTYRDNSEIGFAR